MHLCTVVYSSNVIGTSMYRIPIIVIDSHRCTSSCFSINESYIITDSNEHTATAVDNRELFFSDLRYPQILV